jgi:hypothetical protein
VRAAILVLSCALGQSAAAATGPVSAASSVSEVLAAAAEAMGGQDAVARVQSVTAVAEGRSPGGTYRMEIRSMRDGRVEFRHRSTSGGSEVIVLSGSRAWSRDARTGQVAPVDAGTRGVVRAHDFSMIALDFGSRYSGLELAGVASFSGKSCYRLRGRDASGNVVESYFDVGSHLLEGQTVRDASRPGAPAVRISFDAWRRAGGVLLPSRVTATDQKGDFVLTFTTLAVNDVDEAIFRPPDEPGPSVTPGGVPAGSPSHPTASPRRR